MHSQFCSFGRVLQNELKGRFISAYNRDRDYDRDSGVGSRRIKTHRKIIRYRRAAIGVYGGGYGGGRSAAS